MARIFKNHPDGIEISLDHEHTVILEHDQSLGFFDGEAFISLRVNKGVLCCQAKVPESDDKLCWEFNLDQPADSAYPTVSAMISHSRVALNGKL